MSNPRPIYQYDTEEIHAIVLDTIVKCGLGLGYYYDEASNQSVKIELNSFASRYLKGKYVIHYKNGFSEFSFSTDSLTERRATA